MASTSTDELRLIASWPRRGELTVPDSQAHWEDLESYNGSSNEEVQHVVYPYQVLRGSTSRWSDLRWEQQSMATHSDAFDTDYMYDEEDVQWWHAVFRESIQGRWEGVLIGMVAMSVGALCIIGVLMIVIMIT
jgi:hypothetical protein